MHSAWPHAQPCPPSIALSAWLSHSALQYVSSARTVQEQAELRQLRNSGASAFGMFAGTEASQNRLPVTAIGELVAASHDELKPVTFAALTAADVDAARVGDNFQISRARLEPPRTVSVEDMRILCGDALHALN